MKVLIITDHIQYAPLGALIVGNALKKANFDVTIEKIINHPLSVVEEWKPDVVCFSAHTSPHLREMVRVAQKVKNDLRIKTIWGGIHSTLLPNQIISDRIADHVIVGPGVTNLPKLLTINSYNTPIIYDSVYETDLYPPAWELLTLNDMKSFIHPEDHSLRGVKYGRKRIFYYLITSYGCRWSNCAFCYLSSIKYKWQSYSLDLVQNQIRYLKSLVNMDGIGLWDDDLFYDLPRAMKILNYLKDEDIMYYCEARATTLATNENLIEFLKETGCMQLFIGMESGSNDILRYIKKGATVNNFNKIINLTLKYELPIRCSFIFGFPGETDMHAKQTIKLIKKLKDFSHISISGPKAFTPYPGTSLYKECIKSGWNPPKKTEDWADIHRNTNIKQFPWVKLSNEIIEELESLKEPEFSRENC
jgi:radical SAM superfamily enzyme YgiQ (UPF0313 family)